MKLKLYIGLIFLIIIGIVAFLYYKTNHVNKMKEDPVVPIITKEAEIKDIPVVLTAFGDVIPYQTVAIKARIDSQITAIMFKDGDEVKASQPLFRLDDRALKAQLSELQANLERDKAILKNLKNQYERITKLAKSNFSTTSNLDQAKSAYEAQVAVVNATAAQIENLNVQLDYTLITAPIAGRSGTIKATIGNEVKANDTQPLVTINQITPIKVQFSIAQKYFKELKKAMAQGKVKVQIHDTDKNSIIDGYVDYVDNTLDPTTDTIMTGALFNNDAEVLWPGMYVSVGLYLKEEKGAIIIPGVAVQPGQNETSYVYVVENDTAYKRIVEVIDVINDEAIIKKGIVRGERVIIDGLKNINEGSKVKETK